MKKSIYQIVLASIVLYLIALLTGCERTVNDVSKIVAERDSLAQQNAYQSAQLENMNSFINTISNGLDSIAQQEDFFRVQGGEGIGVSQEQMKQNLKALSELLARQRSRISMLEDSLKTNGANTEGLQNIIAFLNVQLDAKEKAINKLRSEINSKNMDIAQLQSRIVAINENAAKNEKQNQMKIASLNENVEKLERKTQVQQQALVTQSNMINECYMKIATKKQLKQAGILDGKKLNAGGLSPNNFVRVDIRQFKEITINSKKPRILTAMPQSSYTLVRNSDGTSQLSITNPTVFWSTSNYLVISLD